MVPRIARFLPCVLLAAMLTAADGVKSDSPGDIRALLRGVEPDEALKLAQRALARRPQDADMNAALGDVYFRLAEFELAEQAYRKALELEFNCARAHYGMGRLLEARSRWKSARAAYDKAYALDAKDIEILRAWATGRREAAEEIAGLEQFWDSTAGENFWFRERAWSRLEWRRLVRNRRTFVVDSPEGVYRIKILRLPTREIRSWRGLVASFDSGEALRLAIDSSTTGIALRPQAAKRIGLNPQPKGRAPKDFRLGGWGWSNKVRIGTLEFRDCPIQIRDYGGLAKAEGTIGTDVFRMFLVKLDFPRGQLELSPLPSATGGASTRAHPAYWPDEDARQGAYPGSAVPFFAISDRLVVTVLADGRIPGYFLFEPRLGTNILTTRFAALLGLPASPLHRDIVEVSAPFTSYGIVYSCPGRKLRFGAIEQVNHGLFAHDGKWEERRIGVRFAGHLGVPNPADFTVTINYRDAWIDFQLAR